MTSSIQPAGNYYDKYATRNPIARKLMSGFLASFDSLVNQTDATSSIEIGCGEGELSMRLARRGMRVRGYDISSDVVDEARSRAVRAGLDISFDVAAVETLASVAPAPLVVCCEVLEHVDDPAAALGVLRQLAQRWLIASVPREPLWRALNMARGKYLRDFGNTPGHVNHWSRQEFVELVAADFRLVELRSPLPWTMVLCEPR